MQISQTTVYCRANSLVITNAWLFVESVEFVASYRYCYHFMLKNIALELFDTAISAPKKSLDSFIARLLNIVQTT